ncbi:hypothetical protein HU727_015410 [Pseudomonas sp. SWRI153]|uniref:Uncharacterized protein n=1 Tax=Pseudomonas khorasanensis TaxID=2745508 RepID=A0A923F6R6_9PSED|nr:hypothetical protein [Pseudomonas khorasanensis]MBV4486979.1 hypothetical protein [Pseudomonas khorasanensis]
MGGDELSSIPLCNILSVASPFQELRNLHNWCRLRPLRNARLAGFGGVLVGMRCTKVKNYKREKGQKDKRTFVPSALKRIYVFTYLRYADA